MKTESCALAALTLVLIGPLAACGGSTESYTVSGDTSGSFPEVASEAGWRQWGGPRGDFSVEVEGLATSWPDEGPPVLWTRPLGGGYSAIAADRGVLFATYRDGDDDVVIALRADDGTSIWDYRYASPVAEGSTTRFGKGPNATPLVLDDRLITLGFGGVLSCLDLQTGALLWSQNLVEDLGAAPLDFGFAASPILQRDRVIVLVGGDKQAVVALDPADGAVAWRSPAGPVSYSTPLVIDVAGQEQIVYFSDDEVIGLEASSGRRLWSHPCVNEYRNNSTNLIWGDDNLLWVATQLEGGTRALRLARDGDRTTVEELWFNGKISIHFWNAVRVGDHVYASIGSNASILAGIDVTTGEIKWRERGFEQINMVQAGEYTVFLDKKGHLALARLTPEAANVLARTRIVEDETWTVPTLVGTTLFVRNKRSIRALDLG